MSTLFSFSNGYAELIIATFLLAVLIRFVINIYIRFKTNRRLCKDFPGPPAHWLFGNLLDVEYGKGIYKGVEYIHKYGPAYTINLGPIEKQIVMNNPKYIQVVLNTATPKGGFYSILHPWIGDGLLLSKGKQWARNRRLLTPAFHFDILKPYQNIFSQCTQVMVDKWRSELKTNPMQSIEMFEQVSLMTLDSLMKCIFGVDENFQARGRNNPYIKAVYTLSELTIKRILFVPHHNDLIYYFSWNGYRFRRATQTSHNYSQRVIEKRRKEKQGLEPELAKRKYLDFLDILLDCRDEDGKGLTYNEIQDEVDTFMFEGK